jgi:hypothetical protein
MSCKPLNKCVRLSPDRKQWAHISRPIPFTASQRSKHDQTQVPIDTSDPSGVSYGPDPGKACAWLARAAIALRHQVGRAAG